MKELLLIIAFFSITIVAAQPFTPIGNNFTSKELDDGTL